MDPLKIEIVCSAFFMNRNVPKLTSSWTAADFEGKTCKDLFASAAKATDLNVRSKGNPLAAKNFKGHFAWEWT